MLWAFDPTAQPHCRSCDPSPAHSMTYPMHREPREGGGGSNNLNTPRQNVHTSLEHAICPRT
jgi:hypothetical protein